MKTHLRKSSVLKKSEYHSIVGLLTLAEQHQRDLRSIEQALLYITQECDREGKPYEVWGGGHVNDATCDATCSPVANADDLIKMLGLRVQR